MNVAVIGANGGIGRRLLPMLVEAGHDAIGVVRSEAHFNRIRAVGGTPRLGDLEGEFASALDETDAVVFTAGSGGGTGWDKTLMVDLWGARRAVDACEVGGIDRFVMISARGAADPEAGPEPLRPYLVAKRCADDYLQQSTRNSTILRPVTLTDEGETGRVATGADSEAARSGDIPRADVARAVVVSLANDDTIGCAIELYGGETPIEDAIRSAC